MFGIHQARAERRAVDWIDQQLRDGRVVWVGTHHAAGLLEPWAGIADKAVTGFRIYDVNTTASEVLPGHIVMDVAYGEPSGAVLTGRAKDALEEWRVHDGRVTAWRLEK